MKQLSNNICVSRLIIKLNKVNKPKYKYLQINKGQLPGQV